MIIEIFEVKFDNSSIEASIFSIKSDLKTKSSGGYPVKNISLKIINSRPSFFAFSTSFFAIKRFPDMSPTIGFS